MASIEQLKKSADKWETDLQNAKTDRELGEVLESKIEELQQIHLDTVNDGQAIRVFDGLAEIAYKDLRENGSTKRRTITIQITFDKEECRKGCCNVGIIGKITLPPREDFPKHTADIRGNFIIQDLPLGD